MNNKYDWKYPPQDENFCDDPGNIMKPAIAGENRQMFHNQATECQTSTW
jgi:hypothetical protein